MNKSKRIGEILIEKGLLTPEQLAICLEEQKRTRDFIGKILVGHFFVSEQALLEALSAQCKIPCYCIKDAPVNWELLKFFSSSLVLDFRCLPIRKDDYSVTVCITNPLDVRAIQKSEEEARGLRVKFLLVVESEMDSVVRGFKRRQRQQANNSF